MRLRNCRKRPFVDCNKRTAEVVSETFLKIAGLKLGATDAEVVVAFLALAAGELSEAELADWFRTRIVAQGLMDSGCAGQGSDGA